MANRQRAEARRKAAAKAAHREGGSSKRVWMWSVIGVLVVVAIVAVIVAGGSDSKAPAADGTNPTTTVSAIPDSQPVTITGADLPREPKGSDPDTAIGMTAPVVSGLNFQGQPIKLDPSVGPYLVVFLAHWCPHCNVEVPRLLDWKHSGGVPKELNVIGVATAVSKTSVNYPPAQWFSNKGWEWPVLVDQSQGDGVAGKVAVAFGGSGWPYLVLVGKDGKVKMRTSGEVAIKDLQAMVDKALAS